MDTKERLTRYIALKKENENRRERLQRMRESAGIPAMRDSDGSQHTGSRGERMATAVERYLDYEREIKPLLDANQKEMDSICAAVNALADPLEREVLRLRYLEPSSDPETGCESCRSTFWASIADQIYGNPYVRGVKMVLRIHRSALEHLSFEDKTG